MMMLVVNSLQPCKGQGINQVHATRYMYMYMYMYILYMYNDVCVSISNSYRTLTVIYAI